MRVTFARMGTVYIGIKAMLQGMGNEIVVPPQITAETVNLGVKYAPETACYPFKINLGNYLQVAQNEQVDAVLMAGGVGPCRFGYYHHIQRKILDELGYNWHWIVLEPPRGNLLDVLSNLKPLVSGCSTLDILSALRFGWQKLSFIDEIHRKVCKLRPHEKKSGSIDKIYKDTLVEIDKAKSSEKLKSVHQNCLQDLHSNIDKSEKNPVRIAIVGEIFMNLEPAVNLQLEEALGRMGVSVKRTLYITEWVKEHILFDFMRLNNRTEDIKRAAEPYLAHFVGGGGRDSVGNTVRLAGEVDGIIHIMPFTCMPEIIAQSVMLTISDELDVPVLTLIYDEYTGRAGILTRLEAFVDMLQMRKQRKSNKELEQIASSV